MDGIHDLGAKQGFGSVETDKTHTPFPERWEAAVFAMINTVLRSGVARNVDHFRHAVERIHPLAYLEDTYYGRWLGALETLLVESKVLSQEAIDTRAEQKGFPEGARVAARPDTEYTLAEELATSGGARREIASAPRFEVGQSVRAERPQPIAADGHSGQGHTRLPAYIRGATGEIAAHQGGWVYPDTAAHGHGDCPQHLYSVRFSATELYGADADPSVAVYIDLFEPYLKALSTGE